MGWGWDKHSLSFLGDCIENEQEEEQFIINKKKYLSD